MDLGKSKVHILQDHSAMEMKEQGHGGHVNAGFDSYGDSNGKKVADPNGIDVEAAPVPNKKSSKVDQMWDVGAIFCSFSFSC